MATGAEAQGEWQEVPHGAEGWEVWEERSPGTEVQGLKGRAPKEIESYVQGEDESNGAGSQRVRGEIDQNEAQGKMAAEAGGHVPEWKRLMRNDQSDLSRGPLKDKTYEVLPSHLFPTEVKEGVSDTNKNSSRERVSIENGKNKKRGHKHKNEDIFKGLSIYFPKEQWAEMGEWEKIRYKNMKENYEFMIQLGLPAPKPAFMYYARQLPKTANESSESDDEWTPKSADFQSKNECGEKDKRKIEQHRQVSTYSLRKRERKTYMEINEPSDDDYLFCEYCLIFFIDECSVHGPPVFIEDTIAKIGLEKRATLTLPPGLRIGPSGIPKAGQGVWNEGEILPPGIHFGPYEGRMSEEEEAANSGYSWMV
ncbi:putative histone-lysine N-methyltransferase PRDM7 [Varanus komodoensis]|nr:putative histone-lysine N-methyltransferase PRDM7 [Varanus komodoensis]